jgi:hypothetical protein
MGLMPQDLNINSIDDLMWKFIQLKTNDHNYHSPSAYFSLYSNTKFKVHNLIIMLLLLKILFLLFYSLNWKIILLAVKSKK